MNNIDPLKSEARALWQEWKDSEAEYDAALAVFTNAKTKTWRARLAWTQAEDRLFCAMNGLPAPVQLAPFQRPRRMTDAQFDRGVEDLEIPGA